MIAMLKDNILKNWEKDITGHIQIISELENTGYPAWTIKLDDSYGVLIPYNGSDDINESFASARIRSTAINYGQGDTRKSLILTAENDDIKQPFASLCEALIDPGENGQQRMLITNAPILWWKDWKELLGNKNIDERIYDVLGELVVLKHAVLQGEDAEWNGPDGATYDIETDTRFIEAKSSIKKGRREVTISSEFQLDPLGKPLDLIYCRFEPAILTGISIDSILADFQAIGYNTALLNKKLESKGFEQGMSARRKTFLLHEMLQYKIDDSFPRITPDSFIGGTMPANITKFTYTVDLTGLTPIPLLGGEHDGIQNN